MNAKSETTLSTGAHRIWEALLALGVDTVFGYPGGAIMPAYDAMAEYPIRHILTRHEQGASHMADGYARATGQLGFKRGAQQSNMRWPRTLWVETHSKRSTWWESRNPSPNTTV